MNLRIMRLDPRARLPEYATDGAGCFDLRALLGGYVPPGGAYTFPTGLAFEVPSGHAMLVYSRSGHAFEFDVALSNAVAVIDSDFRGDVQIRLVSRSFKGMTVRAGDRIAQAMVVPVPRCVIEEAAELTPTRRGSAGLGSTGVR